LRKPLRLLATDHGVAPRPAPARVPAVWVRHHEEYFRGTKLRVRPPDSTFEYANRDIFKEMIAPARRRGLKVYARILEGSGASIENFSQAVTVDVFGRPTRTGCWRNPEYLGFWAAVVEDLFRSYEPMDSSGAPSAWVRS
jgi:hypothetical protein